MGEQLIDPTIENITLQWRLLTLEWSRLGINLAEVGCNFSDTTPKKDLDIIRNRNLCSKIFAWQ